MQFQINQINQRDFVVFFLWKTNFYRSNNNLHREFIVDGRQTVDGGGTLSRAGRESPRRKVDETFRISLDSRPFFKKARAFRRVHVGRALSFFYFYFY